MHLAVGWVGRVASLSGEPGAIRFTSVPVGPSPAPPDCSWNKLHLARPDVPQITGKLAEPGAICSIGGRGVTLTGLGVLAYPETVAACVGLTVIALERIYALEQLLNQHLWHARFAGPK